MPRKFTPDQIDRILARVRDGYKSVDIARSEGCACSTVRQIARRAGITMATGPGNPMFKAARELPQLPRMVMTPVSDSKEWTGKIANARWFGGHGG